MSVGVWHHVSILQEIQGRGNITLKMKETDSFEKVSILLRGITSKSFMVTSMGSWNFMISRLCHHIVGRDWHMQTVLYHDQNAVTVILCLVNWPFLYPTVLSLWLNFGSMDFILCVFIFINNFLQIIVCGLGSWVGFVGIIFSFFFCFSFRSSCLFQHLVLCVFCSPPLTEAVAICICWVGTLFGCPVIENNSYFGLIWLGAYPFVIYGLNIQFLKCVKVKQSRYRPGVAQRVPGS